MTLTTFNPLRALVMTHTHEKDKGQRSVGSKARVERGGRTDTTDRSTVSWPLTWSVTENDRPVDMSPPLAVLSLRSVTYR